MITVTEYKDQSVGVFGLGKAGEATVAALAAGGAKVFAWDDSEASRRNVAAKVSGIQLAPVKDWPWKEIKALALSPGVPLTHPKPHEAAAAARANGCPIIGDIELLARAQPQARTIAITGTNGKSTTTTLIGHILKTCNVPTEVGGNLGTPVLSFAPLGHEGVYVIETSSYQLDLLQTARFNVAVWLNITPDHIDRHGDIEGYVAAKKHIFERQSANDVAIISIDDAPSRAVVEALKSQRVIKVSVREKTNGIYVENGVLHDATESGMRRYDLTSIVTLTGRHNWQNAAVAYAAAKAIGLNPDDIYKAMTSFAGLRHRLQLVTTIKGVRFINDSKATNADATSHALAPYDTIYWIAGGKPKEGGIESLESYFPKIAHAFLIGQAEEEFAATLKGKASFTQCGTLAAAVEKASSMAFAEGRKGAVVLLSPACASFDQWKNFEERGDAFCAMVETLAAKGAAA